MISVKTTLCFALGFVLTQTVFSEPPVSSTGSSSDNEVPSSALGAFGAEAMPQADNPPDPGPPLEAFVAVGASFGQSSRLADLGWSEEQFAAFESGLKSAYERKPAPFDQAGQKLFASMRQQILEVEQREREAAFARPGAVTKFLQDARKKFQLQQTDSGLCYVIQGGYGGIRPTINDTVVVSFSVTAADYQTQLPQISAKKLQAKMSDLLPGIAEGLQMMTLDSKAMFVIPPELTYGSHDWPKGVDRNTPLLYMVELNQIVAAPAAP